MVTVAHHVKVGGNDGEDINRSKLHANSTSADAAGEEPPDPLWIPVPSTPIAPRWDVEVPVSCNLYYKYPPATESILTNIVRSMVSCPAFYTQVLHLMNRLHLPPPFADCDLFPGNLVVTSEKLLTSSTESVSKLENTNNNKNEPILNDTEEAMDLSGSSESELEADAGEADVVSSQPRVQTRQKRRKMPHFQPTNPTNKIPPKIATNDTADNCPSRMEKMKPTGISDLFETPSQLTKLQLHVPQMLPSTTDTEAFVEQIECGFGLLQPPPVRPESPPERLEKRRRPDETPSSKHETHKFQLRKASNCEIDSEDDTVSSPNSEQTEVEDPQTDTRSLSLNELALRRLSVEQRMNYPVFTRNYNPGVATTRLYIKNLAPSVLEEDLYRVFGSFHRGPVKDMDFKPTVPTGDISDRFSIRLLTEGRMKGQAFVSLPCEQTAEQALEATNGLLLHDRPIVVQFARGAKAKVDEKSLITSSSET